MMAFISNLGISLAVSVVRVVDWYFIDARRTA